MFKKGKKDNDLTYEEIRANPAFVDEKIFPLVRVLNEYYEVHTCASCSGHLNEGAPFISMLIDLYETPLVLRVIKQLYNGDIELSWCQNQDLIDLPDLEVTFDSHSLYSPYYGSLRSIYLMFLGKGDNTTKDSLDNLIENFGDKVLTIIEGAKELSKNAELTSTELKSLKDKVKVRIDFLKHLNPPAQEVKDCINEQLRLLNGELSKL